MIPLKGENIRLRAVEPSDLDAFYQWENDPDNWLISNTIAPFSKHVLEKYIARSHLDIYEARQLRLMIERMEPAPGEEKLIGTIDLFDFDPVNLRAGIGILIAKKEDRMKGLATESLSVLMDYAFNRLHLHQVYCNVSEDNEASLRLFRKSGFRDIGLKLDWVRKDRDWQNVILLQKLNPHED
jgi:diamine N-acetyltransferase